MCLSLPMFQCIAVYGFTVPTSSLEQDSEMLDLINEPAVRVFLFDLLRFRYINLTVLGSLDQNLDGKQQVPSHTSCRQYTIFSQSLDHHQLIKFVNPYRTFIGL